jgi:hypothetical protein
MYNMSSDGLNLSELFFIRYKFSLNCPFENGK